VIYLRLLKESFYFAAISLWSNKLRTFLSLLGITIGIFAIISVFSVIDSLRNSISDSIQSLGDDVVYVHKWPWEMGNRNFPWWKYINRPLPTVKEFNKLSKQLTKADAIAFSASTTKTVYYKSNNIEGVSIIGASPDYNKVRLFTVEDGRYFSYKESLSGKRVAIIGQIVAKSLFGNKIPLNKEIKIANQNVYIIGVFEKEGSDMFNKSMDNAVLIPVNFMKTWLDVKKSTMQPQILVKAKQGIDIENLKDELRRNMRSIRGIKPKDNDNFALNQTSMISKGFESIFSIIDWAGMVIGGFSILVGAFGIANIMFVSVKERTKLIGIQKSLGAKNFFILFQFIFESVFLSILGGILGLILVSILMFFANKMVDMEFALNLTNIIRGVSISFIVGLLAGFVPAKSASKLDPVTAMNSNF